MASFGTAYGETCRREVTIPFKKVSYFGLNKVTYESFEKRACVGFITLHSDTSPVCTCYMGVAPCEWCQTCKPMCLNCGWKPEPEASADE